MSHDSNFQILDVFLKKKYYETKTKTIIRRVNYKQRQSFFLNTFEQNKETWKTSYEIKLLTHIIIYNTFNENLNQYHTKR